MNPRLCNAVPSFCNALPSCMCQIPVPQDKARKLTLSFPPASSGRSCTPSPVLLSQHPALRPLHRALLLALYSSVSLPRPGALEDQVSVSSVIMSMWPRMVAELLHCHTVVPGGREPGFYGLFCPRLDWTLVGLSVEGEPLSGRWFFTLGTL